LIPGPWNRDLSQRQTFDQLSHPGAPGITLILNVFKHLTEPPKYMKQKLPDSSTMTVGDFNTPLSVTDRTRDNKDTEDLNNTMYFI